MSWYTDGEPFDEYDMSFCKGCTISESKAQCDACIRAHLGEDEEEEMGELCTDGRFEVIARAKEDLLQSTNIDTSPDEMAVLDEILFRCWQMGWLDRYEVEDDAD